MLDLNSLTLQVPLCDPSSVHVLATLVLAVANILVRALLDCITATQLLRARLAYFICPSRVLDRSEVLLAKDALPALEKKFSNLLACRERSSSSAFAYRTRLSHMQHVGAIAFFMIETSPAFRASSREQQRHGGDTPFQFKPRTSRRIVRARFARLSQPPKNLRADRGGFMTVGDGPTCLGKTNLLLQEAR